MFSLLLKDLTVQFWLRLLLLVNGIIQNVQKQTSLPGDCRVTDEALLAETTLYDPLSFLWMFSLLLKDLISDFYSNYTK